MRHLMTAAFLAGLCLVAGGAWLIYRPAGILAAGAAMVTVPVLWARG